MFVRNAEFFIFYEDLSSALDIETKRLLWERLFSERNHPTCLIVSHRRYVLHMADHIMIMGNGRIRDSDTLEELLKRCNVMRKLYVEFSS